MKSKRVMMIAGMIVALGATSLPAAPGGGTVVTNFLTRIDQVAGSVDDGVTNNYFSAYTYDDPSGVAQGSVSTTSYNYLTSVYSYIFCSGPAYANAVSVNPGNGNSSVNVTLDPASPSCYSYNVAAPVTISVAGRADGTSDYHSAGTYKQTHLGVTWKGNYQYDQYQSAFNGTNGFGSGPFSGYSYTQRNSQRTQVK